jgi:uncharacterized repeat protein (TIGR01451 family)
MKISRWLKLLVFVLVLAMAVAASLRQFQSARAAANLTVTPITWNVIGLDSNDVTVGPNNFPVGARICNTSSPGPGNDASNVVPTFVWDTTDTYINLRPGSYGTDGTPFPTISSLAAGACVDVYYEVQITRNSLAYNHTARYHIAVTADGGLSASTPTPRAIFVEHLISQSRNYTQDVKLNGVSIPAGGEMNLFVNQTYTITLSSKTATNGYEQIESFINFPNTIFQVLSVNSTYTAVTGGGVSPINRLYNDACTWDNDPNSPNYRSCLSVGKAGGDVVNTYSIKIISGGGTQQKLSNLIYDFSGSSYHYNSDYAVSYRFANIIDPTTVTIAKAFNPNPTQAGGSSTLTISLYNDNTAVLSGANFTDTLPTLPGAMVVANPPNATTSGCGTPTFAPTAGAASLSFSNGTIPAKGYCVIKVNVTVPTTGTYNNTTGHLFIGPVDTGHTANASLVANNNPGAPACTPGLELVTWTFETTSTNYTFKSRRVITDPTQSIVGHITQGVEIAPYSGTTNAWYADNFIKSAWVPPAAPTNPYFEFVVDTRNFTGVSLAFNMVFHKADWSNAGDNIIYAYSSVDGVSFTNIIYNSGHTKQIWYSESAPAAATGLSTTTFRIYASGAQKSDARLYIDNIVITGCGVPQPPAITKAFNPNPVAVNGVSTLTFTFTNENNVALTGVRFTDSLPAGLQVAATPGASTTCGGTPTWSPVAGATIMIFGSPTGATIPARSGTTNGSCTAQVNTVATTAGPHQNVSGFIYSTQTYTNTATDGYATASLTAILPPHISKQFAPNPILSGGVSTLTFVITNPNPDYPLTGVAFNDTFPTSPGAMVVASSPNATTSGCGSPTFAPTAGAALISFSGGTISAGGTCRVKVDVTAPAAGSYANTSGNVSAATVGAGNTASDTLLVQAVHPKISILKQISTNPGGPWTTFSAVTLPASIYYQFTVENTGDVALTSVYVTDPDLVPTPPNIVVCTEGSLGSLALYEVKTCTYGPITASAGSHPNTATAHGTYNSAVYDSTPSTASYATAALTLVKSVAETAFAGEGDVLHYSYRVTNSGYASLRQPVTVDDDMIGVLSCPATETVGDNDAFLDASEYLICTATYTVLAEDVSDGVVTNVASATANGVTSNTDTQTVGLAFTDYDDLPSAYNNTLQEQNGARHTLGDLFMGPSVSDETDGHPDANAAGDTFDDGVTLGIQPWVNGATVDIQIDLSTSIFGGTAAVGIWIDWNNDQVFDPTTDFYPCTDLTTGGIRACPIEVPGSGVYTVGHTVFARVRLFDQAHLPGGSLDAGDSVGLANNGEVEGYEWQFSPTAVTLVDLSAQARNSYSVLLWVILFGAAGLASLVWWQFRRRFQTA